MYAGLADGAVVAFDVRGDDDDGSAAPLCRFVAHDDSATRSIAACAGGVLTGSSSGVVHAFRWRARRDDDAAAATATAPPVLVSRLIGHRQAVVALCARNAAHVVSGAHDGSPPCGPMWSAIEDNLDVTLTDEQPSYTPV